MKEIIDYFNTNDNFIVTSHVSPDGDNIGSTIAINRFLSLLGKTSFHLLDDETPNNLSYITSKTEILSSRKFLEKNREKLSNFTIIALDCANYDRLCIENEILEKCSIINIDHHVSNENYGKLNLVVSDASSTCEVVYNLIKNFDKKYIDTLVTTSLYTGISTDTGNFKFDNVSKETFDVASKLLELGAKKQDVVINLYQSDNINYLKFKSDIILNYLEIIGNISFMLVTQELLAKYLIEIKDTEDLVNMALNISGVEVAILLKEKEKSITKGSLRSKKIVDVNKIASRLGGGGHKRAAGFTLNMDIMNAKKIVINQVKEFMKNERIN